MYPKLSTRSNIELGGEYLELHFWVNDPKRKVPPALRLAAALGGTGRHVGVSQQWSAEKVQTVHGYESRYGTTCEVVGGHESPCPPKGPINDWFPCGFTKAEQRLPCF